MSASPGVLHADQPGEHVAPLGQVGRQPTLADLGVDEPVELPLVLDLRLPRAEPLQSRPAPAEQDGRADVDGLVDPRPQLGEPALVGDTEDDAQDHLEGEGVHPVEGAERRAGPPGRHLGPGQLGDQLGVPAQCGAVERRHQQLAGPLVLAAVLEQQRVLAHDRSEDRVALAGVEDLRVAGEDLLRVLRAGEEHQRPAAGDQPDREGVAEPAVEVRHEPVPEPQQPGALGEDRPAQPGRQLVAAHLRQPAHVRAGVGEPFVGESGDLLVGQCHGPIVAAPPPRCNRL